MNFISEETNGTHEAMAAKPSKHFLGSMRKHDNSQCDSSYQWEQIVASLDQRVKGANRYVISLYRASNRISRSERNVTGVRYINGFVIGKIEIMIAPLGLSMKIYCLLSLTHFQT